MLGASQVLSSTQYARIVLGPEADSVSSALAASTADTEVKSQFYGCLFSQPACLGYQESEGRVCIRGDAERAVDAKSGSLVVFWGRKIQLQTIRLS